MMEQESGYNQKKVNKAGSFHDITGWLGIMILSFYMAVMLLTGGNLNGFYRGVNGWQLDNFYCNNYSCSGMVLLPEQNRMEITEDDAFTVMVLQRSTKEYPYLELTMQLQPEEELPVQVEYYNENGYLSSKPGEDILKNGKQYIRMDGITDEVTRVGFHIYNQKGRQFWLENAAFYDRIMNVTTSEILILTAGFILVFGILYTLLKHFCGKPVDELLGVCIQGSQKVIGKIAEKLNPPVIASARTVGVIRTALFLSLLLYLQYLDRDEQSVWTTVATKRAVVCALVFFVISVISIEKEKCTKRYVTPMLKVWLVQGIMCIASEFIIEKRLVGRGIFMLLILGTFYYIWSNMKEPQRMLWDFTRALEITFVINMGYCMLFVPFVANERYVGFTKNPNVYMMYLLPELLAVAMGVYRNWRQQKYMHLLVRSVGLGIGAWYLNETECRTGLLAMILAALVIGIGILTQYKHIKKRQWIMLVAAGIFALGGVAFAAVLGRAEQVYAVERFMASLKNSAGLNNFSSGRLHIYMEYLKRMNLWGHEYREIIHDTKYDAHNGILTMAYLYGILIIMPYLKWLYLYVKNAAGYCKDHLQKDVFAIFPLLTVIAMAPVFLFENLEQFLRWPVWILFYVAAGVLFWRDGQKDNG